MDMPWFSQEFASGACCCWPRKHFSCDVHRWLCLCAMAMNLIETTRHKNQPTRFPILFLLFELSGCRVRQESRCCFCCAVKKTVWLSWLAGLVFCGSFGAYGILGWRLLRLLSRIVPYLGLVVGCVFKGGGDFVHDWGSGWPSTKIALAAG